MKTAAARNSRSKTTSGDATDFSFSNAPFYAEKDEYIAKNLIFTLKTIEYQVKAGFEGRDRWAIRVSPDDGRLDEIITLQANTKRDAELQAAADHIEKCGPIANVKLVKSGNAYYLRNALETSRP